MTKTWLIIAIWVARSLCRGAGDSNPADVLFAAYNQAFYFTNDDGGFYRETTSGGRSAFWVRAEQMEMVLDVYERTKNPGCLNLFNRLYSGFVAEHGARWMRNDFNDDIIWMVIACARANELTGDARFLDAARSNFDGVFARAWSADLGGGLWWKTSDESKNACVNGPAAIAACLLYQTTHDARYRARAREIFEWERAHLFDSETGQVYDNVSRQGKLMRKAFTYNEGTFIGAANFLGYTNEAQRAADYTKDVLSAGALMPEYGQEGDAAGFNGICVRWLAKFMNDRGRQGTYLKWLQSNAEAAWRQRRTSDDLSWSQWTKPTPSGPLNSWACSSSVVIMQVVPPARTESKGF